jgi:hypothetical protein
MLWLRKATRPIPIVTETGEVIFRNATTASMRRGSWVHPGHPTLSIMAKAKEAARKIVRKRLAKDVLEALRRAG